MMDTVDFKFTKEEFNLIIAGLMELPAKMSMDFILKIDKDAKGQIAKGNQKASEGE